MALQIGPKHVAGIIIQYNLIKYKVVSDCVMYLLYFILYFNCRKVTLGYRGSAVVKVLRYKSEGRWFDPSWCHWHFSLT